MRIVLTGGAGFVGGAVARVLRARGDDVVALVRDQKRAVALRELGAEVVEDDLSDVNRLIEHFAEARRRDPRRRQLPGRHPEAERGAMWDANVGTTTRVLDAAEAARVPRIVYVSTVNVFGNTRGADRRRDVPARPRGRVPQLVRRDEVRRPRGRRAADRRRRPDRHRAAEPGLRPGRPLRASASSSAWPTRAGCRTGPSTSVGVGLVHVDDLAAGIVAALDGGVVGESYVLSGPVTRLARRGRDRGADRRPPAAPPPAPDAACCASWRRSGG